MATLSGDFDLNATQGLIATGLPAFSGHAAFVSQIGFSPGLGDAYGLSVTGTPFGPGGFAFWDSVSGDIFDFNILINSAFIAPPGYAGEALSATAIDFDSDFTTLGFTPGTFISNYVGADGVTTESIC